MIIILLLLITSIAAAAVVYFLTDVFATGLVVLQLMLHPSYNVPNRKSKMEAEEEAEAADAVFEADAIGRTVRYEQAKGCVQIQWIKVYGIEFKGGDEELISLGKPTIGSSEYNDDFVANNIHTYEEGNKMFHSLCTGKIEWIEIDLEKDYKITRIELRNREDCCKPVMFENEGKISILDMDRDEIWSEGVQEVKDEYSYFV
jgi:hypothetical protein